MFVDRSAPSPGSPASPARRVAPPVKASALLGGALAQAAHDHRPLCVLLTFDDFPSCKRQREELVRPAVQRKLLGFEILTVDVTKVIDALGCLRAQRLPELVFFFSDGEEALRLRGFHAAEQLDLPIDEVLRREQTRRGAALRSPA